MADGGYRVESDDESVTNRALKVIVGMGVTSVRTSRPSLEEVYFRVVGGGRTRPRKADRTYWRNVSTHGPATCAVSRG